MTILETVKDLMIRRLAILVALLTMAPPSVWCCCRHSEVKTERATADSQPQDEDCRTCSHHKHATHESPAPSEPPTKQRQDEPCRCQLSPIDLGIVAFPERVTFDDEAFSTAVSIAEVSSFESVVMEFSLTSDTHSCSMLSARARILRC